VFRICSVVFTSLSLIEHTVPVCDFVVSA
jgi:hypothetical protein